MNQSDPQQNSAELSVTGWFHALKDGDQHAAASLWDRYFERVVRLARRRLVTDAGYDEEDLATSVFATLYKVAAEGRYEALSDRDELWALLLVLSQRKMIARLRRQTTKRRSRENPDAGAQIPEEELISPTDSPDMSVAVEDECRHLLEQLEEPVLQNIALLKLDGHTIAEIAEQLDISIRTVSRKILLIRKCWEEELEQGLLP